jgi:quinol monooxygenase YgiN
MIIVHADTEIDPKDVAEVEARGTEFAAKCRAEDGCTEYQLSWTFGAPTVLRLIENWVDMAAYKTHTSQPHVAEWAAWIGPMTTGPLTSHRFDVELVDPQAF